MLKVPESLNRNAKGVREMGDPADSGLLLINYMCARLGIDSLAALDVLDLGCGLRFTQSILNRNAPIGTYTGLEVDETVVDFLDANVTDPRLSYHHVDVLNRLYNPTGRRLDADAPSPLDDARFDLACMFSVITHQQPEEARPIFEFLRRHIKLDGWLFFSAFIHEDDVSYEERDPEAPGHMSSYSLPYMSKLLVDASWFVVSVADPQPNGVPIQTSFLCKPVARCSSGDS